MGYVSYFQFFTELKTLIRDCSLEFSSEDYAKFSDSEFEIKYKTFLGRLQKRCKDYSDNWFFGPSRYIGAYIAELPSTKEYPRTQRFAKLLELTDAYMRGAMV